MKYRGLVERRRIQDKKAREIREIQEHERSLLINDTEDLLKEYTGHRLNLTYSHGWYRVHDINGNAYIIREGDLLTARARMLVGIDARDRAASMEGAELID